LRLQDTQAVVESLAGKQALAPDMAFDHATDLLWALGSVDLYHPRHLAGICGAPERNWGLI
jgi:hypothetical protein